MVSNTLAVLAGLLGLVVGSFLNVVVYRVPRGESIVSPPSHCPRCGSLVRARHNVPVVGWVLLRGRCADCRLPISVRYPLVELVTGLLFAAVALRFGGTAALPAYLWFAGVGVALVLIDLDVRRLPNVIVAPSYPILLALLVGAAAWDHDWRALIRAVIGGAVLFGFYLLLVVAYPAGMGWGDVKLSGLVGGVLAYLSWQALLVGAFAAFVLGAAVGLVAMGIGRGGRKTALPFGPFMIAGVLLAVFAAGPLSAWYEALLV
ncbi:leader peptidase (prepilin peptidase)/N-methyltransferase [Kribbella sp. VKM Ac-2571]|uniref:prepilin peptidase n=1 Tax=Kribbella sp. VKM Ac-2571 TaxID=2512222 RepID=UPI00105CD59E|nr:A24 family peptidase [Kribbella sp. VKM Ac-2571]TDO64044.1 leader peptidase (prepilin peptidase)/N-methyltransferase [Kribbella sp. VKM Ac-2571]